jgi:hypothetical protein
MNIFTQFFKKQPTHHVREQAFMRELMRRESAIGRELFGPIPQGTKRDFFCLDEHTWVWHEQWIDEFGVKQSVTTRYIIRPTEIVKSQNGGAYHRISEQEADNFEHAVDTYVKRVTTDIYGRPVAHA